ncbi:MAG TPA: dTDP-4-dehydrorhamnose reductase [Polyangiaceae bacterium]|nr:dTDP-4-dehydrorhamnose reductase [Polyangiaceae bacterium]
MKLRGRVLLVSPDGMLGGAWKRLLVAQNVDHDEVTYPSFDLTKPADVARAITKDHSWVVNCSAYTDVDGAETHEDVACLVNGKGVGNLVERCGAVGARLVHFSTDYVFDGEASSPYPVDAPHDPVNAYGRSKAYGETLVFESGFPHLMVRTSWLYAPWANNFVRTIVRLTRERPEIRVVDDQRGRPTSAERLALATARLMAEDVASPGVNGVFHLTDGGECTWFELAKRVAAVANPECRVLPCATEEFLRPAKRPRYSVLDLARAEKVLGPMYPWQRAVDEVLARLEA